MGNTKIKCPLQINTWTDHQWVLIEIKALTDDMELSTERPKKVIINNNPKDAMKCQKQINNIWI